MAQRFPPIAVGLTALGSLVLPIFVPRHLVFAIPFPAALINFQWMYDEYYYLLAWSTSTSGPKTDAGDPKINRTLGGWYSAWQSSAGPLPAAIGLPMMWSSSIRFLYLHRHAGLTPITISYAIGLLLAIAHMPAGGKAFPLLKTVGEGKADSMRALKKWLGMHWWRTWLVDAPMTAAFAFATYLVLNNSLRL